MMFLHACIKAYINIFIPPILTDYHLINKILDFFLIFYNIKQRIKILFNLNKNTSL